MEQQLTEQSANFEPRQNSQASRPRSGRRCKRRQIRKCPVPLVPVERLPGRTSMPSAVSKRVSRTLPRKRNLPRLPDGRTPPGKPINRPSMPYCPSAKIATWCGNSVGC